MKRRINTGEKLRFCCCFRPESLNILSLCPGSYSLPYVSACCVCWLTTCLVYFRLLVYSRVKASRFKDATNCAGVPFIHPPGYLAWYELKSGWYFAVNIHFQCSLVNAAKTAHQHVNTAIQCVPPSFCHGF